jgi:hypothetical protein
MAALHLISGNYFNGFQTLVALSGATAAPASLSEKQKTVETVLNDNRSRE